MLAVFTPPAPNIGWLYLPVAVVLGALHGLEPGHSKTMMAAFIIAIRGTISQAVLLGVSATISHTAVIWILVGLAVSLKNTISIEQIEPYLQVVVGVIVLSVALWVAWRTLSESAKSDSHDHGEHAHHDHDHDHHHDEADHHHAHEDRGAGHDLTQLEAEDAHAREHAADIAARFNNRQASTWQIVLFGLTGGLMPCPAAFSVLLICLQTGALALGFAVALAFSIGLAFTLVAVGVTAAWGVRHAAKRFGHFRALAGKAPLISSGVLGLVALYMIGLGTIGILKS